MSRLLPTGPQWLTYIGLCFHIVRCNVKGVDDREILEKYLNSASKNQKKTFFLMGHNLCWAVLLEQLCCIFRNIRYLSIQKAVAIMQKLAQGNILIPKTWKCRWSCDEMQYTVTFVWYKCASYGDKMYCLYISEAYQIQCRQVVVGFGIYPPQRWGYLVWDEEQHICFGELLQMSITVSILHMYKHIALRFLWCLLAENLFFYGDNFMGFEIHFVNDGYFEFNGPNPHPISLLTLCRSNLKHYSMSRKAAFFSVGI